MRIWRISNYADLSGIGGNYKAGRWNELGTLIVYCAEHPALAMLELLVHFDLDDLPTHYKLLEIEVDDSLVEKAGQLAAGWETDARVTRKFWEDFLRRASAPVLLVPSVIMPFSSNFLLNPRHENAKFVKIVGQTINKLDPRLRA